jgi:Glyoxalase-like domain
VNAPGDTKGGTVTGASLTSRVDHVVIVADSLAQGVAWCEAVLGVVPGPGGRHPLMGTHNRLLPIGTPEWPDAYLELIAIDPDAEAPPADGRARWFGMDEPALRARVARGPCLAHVVARTPDIAAACAALGALGEDVGEPVAASRATPQGELRWQISVRRDGRPAHAGALPALIEWQGPHPCEAMRDVGLRLRGLTVHAARPEAVRAAHAAIGLVGVDVSPATATADTLALQLSTPRGPVLLWGGQPASAR